LISAILGTTDPLPDTDAVINEALSDFIPFPSNSSAMVLSKLLCTGERTDDLASDL
jgi:hypothetical protein